MNWKTSATATDNARRELPRLMQKYFKAGRKAVKAGKLPRDLHRFRVKTKRLRYALEIFRPVYGPSLEARLKGLQKLQHILGSISDSHAIHSLVGHKHELGVDLIRSMDRQVADFRAHWNTVFDRPGELERWTAYLSRAPRKPPRKQLTRTKKAS